MQLRAGTQLGPYEILSPLGAGGMGEVYRARDSRLGREVAVKVLGGNRARDREALERFEREARAASALNHPNIVTIYDIGRSQCGPESIAYIAMELVEGQSLRQIISEGPVEMERLLGIATQAVRALAAAHQKGIVHRDLKPENIMLAWDPEGRLSLVKILDFGLAKLELGASDSTQSSAATTSPLVTGTGVIMGTAAYMSPEQASGRPADFRSDQFSLGAVLYEMATGRRAFGGGSGVETLAAILRDEPETISQLNPGIPLPLQWAIKRCLAKNPAGRYASTLDLASDLAIVRDNLGAPGPEAASSPLHNLPVQRTPLVGRDRELEAVKQLLMRDEVRLVVLTGPGGTGKTRLAVQVAEDVAQNFGGGVYFVSLASVSEPNLVGPTIAQALGVREAAGKPLLEVMREHVRQAHRSPTLLILDNFEHVLGAAPLVAELLEGLPATKILVTSRSMLRLYGEHEFSVPPLSLPDLERLPDVETLAKTPAVSLFLQRAVALKPGFTLTQENMRAVAEICAHLDGLPLAIELAAARIKLLSPAAMLARLQSRLQWLTGGARDLPERQKTLRATLDWSYELLQPAEQKLFRRMSVFVSGCTLEAAEAVSNARSDLDEDVLDAIASLVDKSLLLQSEVEGGEARFRMLETIREYALERLASSGDEKVARRAHAAFCLVLAEEGGAQLTGPQRQEWLNRFDLEQENFRAALDWLTRTGNAEWGLRLASALHLYWMGHASPVEGRNCLWALLNLPAKPNQAETPAQSSTRQLAQKKLRANALVALSSMALEQGDFPLSRTTLQEALAIYRELDHLPGVVMALNHLAAVERNEGNYAAARSLVIETTRIWQEAGDLVSVAHATSNLADLARAEGDYAAALSLHQECLSIYSRLGDRTSMAWSLDHQGDLALEQGDLGLARSLYEQALEIFRDVGAKAGIARALTDLGNLACSEGAFDKAQELYAETLTLFSELGETRDITRVLEGIACATADSGKWERALRLAGAAAELRQSFGTPLPPSAKASLEKRLEAARTRLSSAAAAKAWMEGSRMTPQAAIEYALAERTG
jgi:predicted ATPase/serine/threonine protein kinase/tetratricopeptide (TPR) repeat protein